MLQGASKKSKKVRDVSKGGWGGEGGVGSLQKNVHMTFLVDKIDVTLPLIWQPWKTQGLVHMEIIRRYY